MGYKKLIATATTRKGKKYVLMQGAGGFLVFGHESKMHTVCGVHSGQIAKNADMLSYLAEKIWDYKKDATECLHKSCAEPNTNMLDQAEDDIEMIRICKEFMQAILRNALAA